MKVARLSSRRPGSESRPEHHTHSLFGKHSYLFITNATGPHESIWIIVRNVCRKRGVGCSAKPYTYTTAATNKFENIKVTFSAR